MSSESVTKGFGGAGVVMGDGRAEHDDGAAFVVGGVVVYNFPGRESRFEGAILSKTIEFRLLDKYDVRVFGEVADVF